MNYMLKEDGIVVFQGDVYLMVELLETMIEEVFGYHPLLQECEEDGELEIFVHSDSYEMLSEDEIKKLEQAGITDDNCIKEICELLKVSIIPISEEEGKEVVTFWGNDIATKTTEL